MATSAGAVELTKVDSTQQFPLGLEHTVEPVMAGIASASLNRGTQVWVYVFNDESSTAFSQGTLVQTDTAAGTTSYDGIVTTGAVSCGIILGVAQHTIAAGSYGWILKRGQGKVLCDGNVTAFAAICPDASAGLATDVATAGTDASIGYALADDTGASTLVTARLNCPG